MRKVGRPINPELIARCRESIPSAAALNFARRAYALKEMQKVADELRLEQGAGCRYLPADRDRPPFVNIHTIFCEDQTRETHAIFLNGILRERLLNQAPGAPFSGILRASESHSE
jgi:hypothetical protein